LSGNGKEHFAALLNEAGIPNPTKLKQELGWSYVNGALVNDFGLWSRTSVGRILRDQMYTGDLVQGRTKKVSYKSKRMIAVPESDWIIAPDTHEAIIDRETFATVRRLLGERTRSDGTGEVHSLAGKVKCMDCGSTLAKYAHSANGAHHAYLRCKLYATDKSRCTKHIIRLDLLEEQVLLLLRQFFRQSCDASRAETLFSGNRRQPAGSALEREIKSLSVEAERRSKALRDLYLDKSRGLLDEAQFWELNRGYLAEKSSLQRRLDALREALSALQAPASCSEPIENQQFLPALSRELVAACVDRIEVGERDEDTNTQRINIRWLF
ncbi:MAG: recombinase family protein, partial [Oscillospiraceae bacterium]